MEMASISIKLSGNLGDRHRLLNTLVHDIHHQKASYSIRDFEEPTHRLLAIDIASRQKKVDYILQNLKDDDMLCVTRALKSFWLLEPQHSNIINPYYLEHQLFPQMRLQAVNKMRKWIQLYLRDSERCQEFYQFYKNMDFTTAAKFLWHCSNEYIMSEFRNILEKITPKLLKVLSEKVPRVTKIYLDSLTDNQTLLKYYLENDSKFYANIKYLLKPDADLFFYVLENFFATGKFPTFNRTVTKCIIKNHKNKFILKSELYTSRILDIGTLSKRLDPEEIKELILKLAKAEYLGSWFTYKTVEPLIKSLNAEDRKTIKKIVFVDKAFGETVKEWPYAIPVPPKLTNPQRNLFEDPSPPIPILNECCRSDFRCMLKKRKYAGWPSQKTLLDELFDKYRFYNYKKTLLELQRRLKAESSPQNRQYMLLVLISKTGGQTENLISFLNLLSYYTNEPVQIRATIIRSLVKRAFVWRLPPEHWTRLLKWGHGLGLDGSQPEAACHEGLHAVVLRDLLTGSTLTEAVWKAYLNDFSPLTEYNLTADERVCLSAHLPRALLDAAQSDPNRASKTLHLLLDTLTAYQIKFDSFPGTLEAIKVVAERDFESAKGLLSKLYELGVARKNLIRENFVLIQTDDSYVNALRHDLSLLENTTKFEELIVGKYLKHEKFLRKLVVYFTEKDGLRERYRTLLEFQVKSKPDKILARALALLSGSTFLSFLKKFDGVPSKTPHQQLAAALRANAHVVRPPFEFDSFGWRALGAKGVANRVATCRQVDVERYLKEALSWRRTLRLALILAKRVNQEYEAFKVFASKRPVMALFSALQTFQNTGKNLDPRIWDIVKAHILKTSSRQLSHLTTKYMELVPRPFRAEYCVLVYKACKTNLPDLEMTIFSEISAILPEVDEQFMYEAIESFLQDHFKDRKEIHIKISYIRVFIPIIANFLLLATSEEMLQNRLQKVGMPFLKQLEFMMQVTISDDEYESENLLHLFLLSLRYNKAFYDDKYVSCLSVFEKIIEWMHRFLPVEKWFDTYVTMHLTTIYYKTVKQCLKQNPELFCDGDKKIEEGPNMLGTIFGIFLASDIDELTKKSFASITELYGKELVLYFNYNFYVHRDGSIEKFTKAVLNGLLKKKSMTSYILARRMFWSFREQLESEKLIDDIEIVFKKSKFNELVIELEDDLKTTNNT